MKPEFSSSPRSRLSEAWLVVTLAALAIASTCAWSAYADEIVFDGSQANSRLSLSSTQSHTLYEDRVVPDTCFRQVYDGDRPECHPESVEICGTQTVCREATHEVCEVVPPFNQKVCKQIPGGQSCGPERSCSSHVESVCHPVAVYHTESYACSKTITVAVGEQLDYRVRADVNVSFAVQAADPRSAAAPQERLSVSLSGTDLRLRAAGGSGRYLMMSEGSPQLSVLREKAYDSDTGEKAIDAHYAVTLIPVVEALSPVAGRILDVSVSDGVLSFTVGQVLQPELLAIDLRLTQKKRFWFDSELFKAQIPADAMRLQDGSAGRSLVQVDLRKLKLSQAISGGNYKLELKARVAASVPGRQLLNASVLGAAAEATQTSEFKLSKVK